MTSKIMTLRYVTVLSLVLLLTAGFAKAQTNDNFADATELTSIDNFCSVPNGFTTSGATPDEALPSNWTGGPFTNVWYKFTATTTEVSIKVEVGSMNYPRIALHDASKAEIQSVANAGSTNAVGMSVNTLTIGDVYYINVSNGPNGGHSGTFTLCVDDAVSQDFPAGAVTLTHSNDNCSALAGYNTRIGTADGSKPSYWANGPNANVWFKFQATTSEVALNLNVSGAEGNMKFPRLALHDNNMQVLANVGDDGNSVDIGLSHTGLTIGDWYYINVDNGPNAGHRGSFTLCIDTEASYDYPAGAIELTNTNSYCSDPAEFTTLIATPDGNRPSTWTNGPNANVWFTFIAGSADVTIDVKTGSTEGNIFYPKVALHDESMTELASVKDAGQTVDVSLVYNSLTAGQRYYINMDNGVNQGHRGTFTLCVDNPGSVPTVPTPPTNLAATAAGTDRIDLAWDDVATETSYTISRSTTSGTGFTVLAANIAANTTTYSDIELTPNTTYFYKIEAINGSGSSGQTAEVSATTDAIPVPAVPTNLTATAAGTDRINLTWDDVATETSYTISRSTTSGTGFTVLAANIEINTTAYSDIELTANTTYFYKIEAINGSGSSGQTVEVSATTDAIPVPSIPANFTATTAGIDQIDLSWDDVATETSYTISRSTTSGTGFTVLAANIEANTTTYSDIELAPNTTYFYKIEAINGSGSSGQTVEASATTGHTVVPSIPTNLTATAAGTDRITLNWDDVATDEGYTISRSTTSGTGFTVLASNIEINSTTYTDQELTANTTYFYKIEAINAAGSSGQTAEVSATTDDVTPPPTSTSGIYVNFTKTGFGTSSDWNHFASNGNNGMSMANLADDQGTATGIDITLTTNWNGTKETGGMTTGIYPQDVTESYIWTDRGNEKMQLSNLDVSKQYNFTFFSSRDHTGNRTAAFVIGSTTVELNASGNTNNTVSIDNISPNADGTIEISVNLPSGSSIAYLNAMIVETVGSTGPTAPNAPSALVATTTSSDEITLTWTDNSDNETGFEIERSIGSNSNYELIHTTASDATTYADTGLSPETYYYRVRAVDVTNSLFSDHTTESSATIEDTDPGPGQERTFLIDLGNSTSLTSGNWNNMGGPQRAGNIVTDLIDAQGGNSTIAFEVVSDASNGYGNGFNSNGPTNALGYPSTANSDSYFSHGAGGTYKLTGLDNTKTYTLTIFGSRNATSAGRVGTYTINGVTQTLDGQNNTTNTISFADIQPDTNNEIILDFGVEAGSNFGYMNVLEVVEKSSAQINAPSGLRAVMTLGRVELSWTDNSNNETGFEIRRSTSANDISIPFITIGADITQFMDIAVEPSTTYYYQVRATDGQNESDYTNEVSVTTDAATYDDIAGAITLVHGSNLCSVADAYTTMGMSGDGLATSCNGQSPNSNVWFKFQATTNEVTIDLSSSGASGSLSKANLTLWDSDFTEISCNKAADGNVRTTNNALTTGAWYYISVDNYETDQAFKGTFSICVDDVALITADASNGTSVVLSWVDQWTDESGFEIRRSASGGTPTLVGTVPQNSTSFIDDNEVFENGNYQYEIKAVATANPISEVVVGVTTVSFDNDGDGFSEAGGDCNDSDPNINPGAVDIPGDGIDQDCNGLDAALSESREIWININSRVSNETVWNNLTAGHDAMGSISPLFETAFDTRISMEMLTAWDASPNQGMARGANHPELHRSHFRVSTDIEEIRFTGLDVTKTYTFKMLSSFDNVLHGTGVETSNTIFEINGQTVTADFVNNLDLYVELTNVVPNASGEVLLLVRKGDNDDYGYLNAIRIEYYITAPETPTGLTVNLTDGLYIDLSWDNMRYAENYEVWRSTTSGSGFEMVTDTQAGVTTYDEGGAMDFSTTYYYMVKATNAVGASAFTEEVSVTTDPLPPTAPVTPANFMADGSLGSEVTLTWIDLSDNEEGFEVYRSIADADNFTRLVTTDENATSFVDFTALENTRYDYQIRAKGPAGLFSGYTSTDVLTASIDNDGDGYNEVDGDCNDADPTIRPGTFDIPNDGIDQDCNGADANADSRTVLININASGSTNQAAPWNNLSTRHDEFGEIEMLLDDQGQSTGIKMSMLTTWDARSNNEGVVPGLFPDNVMRSFFRVRDGEAEVEFSGLNPGLTYNFRFMSSYDNNKGTQLGTSNTVFESNGESVEANFENNPNQLVQLSSVQPLTDGKIIIKVSNGPNGNFGYLNAIEMSYTEGPPASPPNFIAVANGTDQIDLSWIEVDNATSYEIERSLSSSVARGYRLVHSALPEEISWSDLNLNGGRYYYRIRAVNLAGSSDWAYISPSYIETEPLDVPDQLEIQALRDIYENLGGVNWTNNSGWPSDDASWDAITSISQVSGWHGVSTKDGNISRLQLHGINVKGNVPPAIGELKALNYVRIAIEEGVDREITDAICQLKQVRHFQLNIFSGASVQIPDVLWSLTDLTTLVLGGVGFTGEVSEDIGNLKDLETLILSNSRFSGPLPESLTILPNLTFAALQFNDFNYLPNLKERAPSLSLFVSHNMLTFSSMEQNLNGPTSQPNSHDFQDLSIGIMKSPDRVIKVSPTADNALVENDRGGGEHTNYQWQELDQNGEWQDIVGKNDINLGLGSIDDTFVGRKYRCEMTNNWIINMTLYSSIFEVEKINDPVRADYQAAGLYDGTITSMQWRTDRPEGVIETDFEDDGWGTYLFDYDEKYQITEALWGERTVSGVGVANNKYRLNNLTYDPNGNIQSLRRYDGKGDQKHDFAYDYNARDPLATKNNQLEGIAGHASYHYNKIGQLDFEDVEEGEDKYVEYDVSGKVVAIYSQATFNESTGTYDFDDDFKEISYAYDDRGFRLCKRVEDTKKETWYLRDASGNLLSIYERQGDDQGQVGVKTEIPIYGSGKIGVYYPQQDGTTAYELTDHLGNVRAVVKRQVTAFAATMEDTGEEKISNPRVEEMQYFENLFETAVDDAAHNHTPFTDASYSSYLYWGGTQTTPTQEIGPSIGLKVSASDKFNPRVWAQYEDNAASYNRDMALATIIGQLSSTFSTVLTAEGLPLANDMIADAFTGIVLSGPDAGNTVPHAYLNYALFDDDFELVEARAKRVTTDAIYVTASPDHEEIGYDQDIKIEQDGYLFVWVSNESQDTRVWFDDLTVNLTRGIVTQSTDYYPFGSVARRYNTPNSYFEPITPVDTENSGSRLADNIIARYEFNSWQGDLNDLSGTNAPITANGGSSDDDINGNRYDAYELDGIDDYLTIADASHFDFGSQDFAVSFWVKKRESSVSFSNLGGVGKWNSGGAPGTNEWNLSIGNENSDTPNFAIESGNDKYVITSTQPLTVGQWNHVLGQRKDGMLHLYVDGVSQGSLEVGDVTINDVGLPVYVGRLASGHYSNAVFDDVLIFNRALTSGEINGLAAKNPIEAIDLTSEAQNQITFGQYYRYGFQGEFSEEDGETEWNSFEARMYDPVVGRWLSVDPLRVGFSPFVGFANNPLTFVDEGGREPILPQIYTLNGLLNLFRRNGVNSIDDAKALFAGNSHTSKDSNNPRLNFNAFIYTKAAGWLDMKHFFAAAGAAELGVPVDLVLFRGENVEKGQLKANHGSAYSYEDLQSNLQGALFGDNIDGDFIEEFTRFMNHLGHGTLEDAPNKDQIPEHARRRYGQVPTNFSYIPMYAIWEVLVPEENYIPEQDATRVAPPPGFFVPKK
ncbi:MAG: fibronectin type III domain-containing protein [Bacteroidota bacterium]